MKEIKAFFEKIENKPTYFRSGVVNAVNKALGTCELKDDADDMIWYDVRLRAAVDESDLGVLSFPKVGSKVLFGQLSSNQAFVCLATEIESVSIKGEDITILLDKDGLKINTKEIHFLGDTDTVVTAKKLKTELDKLIDHVAAIANAFNSHLHPTPAGPSSPPTVPFTQNLPKPSAEAFGNEKLKTS